MATAMALWVGCIVAAFGALQFYAVKAGPAHAPAQGATPFLNQHRQAGRPLLVMAVHPLCPCSEASLAELGDLLARSRGTCDALLLQFHPEDGLADWPAGPASRQLGGVNVPVVLDRGGAKAAAIGAATSGHALLVDARGEIRFQGGITVSRGHRGRAPAQDAILAIVAGGQPALASAPVYGCALEAPCQACLKP